MGKKSAVLWGSLVEAFWKYLVGNSMGSREEQGIEGFGLVKCVNQRMRDFKSVSTAQGQHQLLGIGRFALLSLLCPGVTVRIISQT